MGKRGPRPLPTAVKKQRGTFQPCRAPANEFQPKPGTPVAPKYLTAVARAEWNRVVPELERNGVLTVVDGGVLEGYCTNYAIAVKWQQLADKKPMVKTMYGPKVNPAAAEARKAWALMRQLAAELGLSPSARTRVGTPEKPPAADPTEDFLYGKPRLAASNGAPVSDGADE